MLRAILDRPVSVVIATLALVVIGLFSLLRLPVSLLPTLERPRLQVTINDADRSREEFLQSVVEPLERRFMSLRGVVEVSSVVDDGHCRLTLETEWQTDVDRLRIDAERRLGDIVSHGLDGHQITVEAGDKRPILEIAVLGGTSAHARSVFAKEILLPEIARLAGAGQVRRFGGGFVRPVVRPHGASLTARGMTASDVVGRLQGLGQSRPAGQLRDGARVRTLTVREGVDSLEKLRQLRLAEGATTLGDVANVSLEEIPDSSSFHWNGEDAVVVELHRAPGANAVLLAREARKAVEALSARMANHAVDSSASGLRLEVVRDSSLEIIEALVQLGLAGLMGLVLGTLVMRWMLGSWRPTLALMLVVPASLVAAFGGFYLWDVSLDIVSLAGLALAAGMLVDNSIVVLEAIERARTDNSGDAAEAAYQGTSQIMVALVASFLTTAVVFLPLIYLHGLARAFFGVQAFAIVTALAVSLVLSLSLTPVLSRRLASGTSSVHRGRSPGLGPYLALLDQGLRHPWVVIVGAALVLAAGAALLPILPRELVPRGPSSVLAVEYRLPASLDDRAMAERARQVDARLRRAAGEPTSAVSLYHGRDQDQRLFANETERGRLELVYTDAKSLASARLQLTRELERLPGVAGEIHLRRGAVAAALERSRSRIEIEASSTSPRRAELLGQRLAEHLTQQIGVVATITRQDGGDSVSAQNAFVLDWNAFRLAQLQTDPQSVTPQIGHALGGFLRGRVDMEGVEPEILVDPLWPTDPRLLPIRPANSGADSSIENSSIENSVVPLGAIASVEQRLEKPALERRNARPAVKLALDADTSVSPSQVKKILATLPLAVDEEVRLVGQAHELERSFNQLRWALLLALVLVFLTVAALYESLTMPLVVMMTVPVAAAGALGALQVAGQSLNVMSFLGLIMLAGIVVNNAIVLVHRIEQRQDEGLASEEAIRQAAEERFRPILMTTVTTLLGMIPLAALGGEGLELRRALALAVSGGLVTSLFAALFVVPILYRALVRRKQHPVRIERLTPGEVRP